MTLPAEHWVPCSDAARERADPLPGTASRGLRWFLLEVATSWGANALLDAPFDRAIGRALVRRVEAADMRILAIRRSGRRTPPAVQRWAIVDSRPGTERIVWGEESDARALLDRAVSDSILAVLDAEEVAIREAARSSHFRAALSSFLSRR